MEGFWGGEARLRPAGVREAELVLGAQEPLPWVGARRARKRQEMRAPPSGRCSWAPSCAGADPAGGGRGLCPVVRLVSETGVAGTKETEAGGHPGSSRVRLWRVLFPALGPGLVAMGAVGAGPSGRGPD